MNINYWFIFLYLILFNLAILDGKAKRNVIDRPLMYSSDVFNFIFFTIPSIIFYIFSIILLLTKWKLLLLLAIGNLLIGQFIIAPILEIILGLIYVKLNDWAKKTKSGS